MSDVARLGMVRNEVTNLSISTAEAIGNYTRTNGELLNLVVTISSLSTNSDVSKVNTGYVNLLMGKERAGIERAELSKAFSTDKISTIEYEKFKPLNEEQNIFFESFLAIATPSEVVSLQKK